MSIAISLVESFQAIISTTAGDHQGILYGGMTPGQTIVLAGQEVAAFDSKEMCIAMSRSHDPVVGCYRIREGKSLALTTAELDLASTLFANAGSVVLLIERRPGRAAANFFFLSEGTFLNIPLLEFPVDAARLRRRTHQLKNLEEVAPQQGPAQETAPQGQSPAALPAAKPDASAGASALPQEPSEERKQARRRGNSISILAILVCLALFALSAVLYVNRLPKPAAGEVTLNRTSTGAATALRAERQGEDLKIIWDLSSAGVAGATAGVLDIDDGGARQQIRMTADQVRFGSVLYTPVSAQVSVQLTMLRDNQNIGQGAVLVLLNKPPQAPVGPGQQKVPFEVKAERQIPVQAKAEPTDSGEITAPVERTPLRSFVPPPTKSQAGELQPADAAAPPVLNTRPAPSLALTGLPAVQLPPPGPPRSAPSNAAEEARRPNAAPAAANPAGTGQAKTKADDYVSPVMTFQAGVRMPSELPRTLKPIAVTVVVDLDPSGRVTHAEPVAESGIHKLLLQAATDAAWKCRFQPARNGPHPVSSRVTLVFHVNPGAR